MQQEYFNNQPAESEKVGKKVGMSGESIPTSFPHSEQKVGTDIPTHCNPIKTMLIAFVLLLGYMLIGVLVHLAVCQGAELPPEPQNTLPPTPMQI